MPLPLIGRPARVRGHRGRLLLLASSGSLYKHSARRRIDNKHPQFLQNAKTASTDSGSPGLPRGQLFGIFSELCAGGGCGWPQWVEASWADRGQRGEQPRRGCSASPRLVSGLARRHPPAAPNIASSKQPTGPAVDAAWPARNVCIGSPPVACLVYLFTIGCHRRLGPAGLASKQHDTAKGAGPSKQGQPMVNT